MLFRGELIGGVHQLHGVLITVAAIRFASLRLSDPHRISRLEKLQWQLGIQNYRVKLVSGWDIAAPLHKFILCIDSLRSSPGVGAQDILEHDNIRSEERRVGKDC